MRARNIYGHPSAARTRFICKCLGLKVNLTSRALDCVRNGDICHLVKVKRQNTLVPLRARSPNLGPVFIISDMGEFNSTQTSEELLSPHGIMFNTTCPYVPVHNGVIERFWSVLSDATVCQLIASALSEEFWEESARCANYSVNFLIFGSVCFVKDLIAPKQPRPKGTRGIIVGYEERHTVGYRIYLPAMDNFIVSFHVKFSDADNLFPGLQIPHSTNDTNGDTYDNVLRDAAELNSTDDSTKETRSSCKKTSPDAHDTRNLRRSARLRDPDIKAFVSAHNYTYPAHSPSFHSPTKLKNKTLSVALDDIGNIHCNDPLTINYPWLKTLSLSALS